MELKDTLLMPKTKYAMKASLNTKEPLLEKKWEEDNIYKNILEKNKNNKVFYLHDGPPYANGNLHLGHALNKILKDFIIRFKSMQGYYTPVIFGWDTHGLPIENALLKNKKIKARDLSINEFRDKCREYALLQVANQKEQFFRLGVLGDKNSYYVTLDKEYEAEQIRVFAKMIKNDMIFKGLKPVYWSPSSVTALAEAEIEYMDKKSPAIYVSFDTKLPDYQNTKIIIWTTTPWTIPANQGVAVGENIEYSLISNGKINYLIATKLKNDFIEELNLVEFKEIKKYLGKELEGIKVVHPLNKKEFQVMLGAHVTDDSGTGAVHTAPGHGEDDYIVGKKYNLEILVVVDKYGKMINSDKYDGIFYEDANKAVGEDLEKSGALLKLEFIKHSYPHDWRTKKPVIFRATPQWFASIEKDKEGMLGEIKGVNWINSWGEKRLYNMIEDRQDWVISRQRKWGVPIPIIYNEDDSPIFDQDVLEHIANLFEKYGSNIWFEKDAKDLLPDGYSNEKSPNNLFTKEKDIMDVWFDSGVSHSAVMKKRLGFYPADLYLEGSDQYRGWLNSSLITGYVAEGKAPYKSVLTHGFTLDKSGDKMSKSKGNTILPKDIYQKYGADVLRLWVATVDYQNDVPVSDELIKQISEIYRRLRNSFRFILGNLQDGEDFNDQMIVKYNDLGNIDKYILIKLDQLNKKVQNYYEKYEFKKIVDEINDFITNDLSAFYFDYIKDILYIDEDNSPKRRSVQTVLFEVFNTLLPLVTPIIPHTADETWNYLYNNSIFLENFKEIKEIKDEKIEKEVILIKEFKNIVNKAIEEKRNEKIIGKSFEAKVEIYLKDKNYEFLKNLNDLSLYLIISKLEFIDEEEYNKEKNNYYESEIAAIKVEKYSDYNCKRCWKYYQKEELNANEICISCAKIIGNMEGIDE